MAPFLNENISVKQISLQQDDILDFFEELDELEEKLDKKLSVWIKENNTFRASTDVTIQSSLPPGIYKPSWCRDLGYYCESVHIKTDELHVFSDNVIGSLLTEVDLFWSKSELYNEHNLVHKRGILLEGNPGNGKTCIINLLSKSIINKGGVVFFINSPRDFETYLEFLRVGFRKIEKSTPVITIIEDIDYYKHEMETMLLDFLDGKYSLEHHIMISTSNDTEEISEAVLRPNRIDLRIEIINPSEVVRKEFLEKKGVTGDLLETLVTKSEGFSFAEIKELFISVVLLDYKIEVALDKIKNPNKKKNYKTKSIRESKFGI